MSENDINEPIVGVGKEDKLTIQKSRPLLNSLWKSNLTLREFKILDVYLGRINSHDPDHRSVEFSKQELQELLNVTKIQTSDLKENLRHLVGEVIEIPDLEEKDGYRLVTLFEEAKVALTDDRVNRIQLECTQKAQKYFFNVENLGYLRYKLRCVISITSRYTYIMFCYLEENRFRGSWTIGLEDLKKLLQCEDDETYKEYKRFNDRLLKRVYQEMHEKTECHYSYEPVKNGRKVTGIRFTVEPLPDFEGSGEKQPDVISSPEKNYIWATPLQDYNFSRQELNEIFALICTIPDRKLPAFDISYGDIDIQRYHYIDQKVKEMIRRNNRKAIPHPFEYLMAMIKNDDL